MGFTLREIGILFGYDIDRDSERSAESSIQSLKSMATAALGAIGIGFSLVQLNAVSEEFSRINDQIRSATAGLGEQSDIQQKILASANATRTSYDAAAEVISKLVHENGDLFADVDEAVKFNNAATMLFKSAGKTNDQIAGLMEAVNKSFAKGYADSETIGQLLEQAPEAVALLNERLGKTSDPLEDMVSDGAISLEDLKGVFVDNADVIAQSFGDVRYNVTDALLNIRNQWGLWVAGMDESLGITEAVGTTMVKAFTAGMGVLQKFQNRVQWMSEKLGGVQNLFKLIGIIAAAAFGTMAMPKVLSFLAGIRNLDRALLGVKLKMAAIVAVIVLIALLVEDFIAFLRGENSVIGTLFDKAGIGAENARRAIFGAWNGIKRFLLKLWGTLGAAARAIFGALVLWWQENGEGVKASFAKIWGSIKALCEALWNALSSIARAVFGALRIFWDAWGETILSVFGILWNTLISMIQPFLNALSALIDFLASVFTGDWEGAWNAVRDIAAAVWEMIKTAISGAWDAVCAVWSRLGEWFGNIFEAARNIIAEKVSAIKETIMNGLQKAIDWITSLPAEAFQWGKDIVSGIVDGIRNGIDTVSEAVSGVASRIRSFLHFSEPDEGPLSDFHTYMPDMIDLMAAGITEGKKKVRNALEGVTGDMSLIAHANVVSGATAKSVSGSANVSRSVVQNVNIHNQFNGERAGQKRSSEAMERASEDAADRMARALAFAR